VEIDLWNTSYVFNKGHSIRVAVSSSNYPRFKANPNTGVPIGVEDSPLYPAKVVQNTLHYADSSSATNGGAAVSLSYLVLPTVTKKQLPRKILPLASASSSSKSEAEKSAAAKEKASAIKITNWALNNAKTSQERFDRA
jgi:hypothetical protein